MHSRDLHRFAAAFLLGLGLLSSAPVSAGQTAVVSILQGTAALVRQTNRLALAEGATLGDGEIVETPPGAFLQIEFDDGVILGVGEGTKFILAPRLTNLKTNATPRVYLLEGWLKVRLPAKGAAGFDVLGAQVEFEVKTGAAVMRVQPKAYALFVETGSVQLVQRDGARESLAVDGGKFVGVTGSDKASVAARVAPDFLQQLPRPFRESLPARASLFANRVVTLEPLGAVSYADVSPWLHTEPGIRLALSRQWRSRAADRAFRAEVAANLSAHMEWERVIFPERFLPKKPPPPPPPPPRPAPREAPPASSPVSLQIERVPPFA